MNSSERDRDGSPDYMSYLVRLWRVNGKDGQGDQEWRASLEEPLTQEIRRFDNIQSLLAFLVAQTGQSVQVDAHDHI